MCQCTSNVSNKIFYRSLTFTIKCLNKIDMIVRKSLKEMNYRNSKQSIEKLYVSEKYLWNNLMSNIDIHLRCLIKIYKEIKEREK